MSEEWIAGLITITVIVGLIAWVPCLHGLNRCVNALIRASERQSSRYGWRRADLAGRSGQQSGRSETQKVFRSS
jgi:hypothetical protein